MSQRVPGVMAPSVNSIQVSVPLRGSNESKNIDLNLFLPPEKNRFRPLAGK